MIITIEQLKNEDLEHPVVVTSGGFDPLHVGHLRCLFEASKLGKTLIVVVNGDGFLMRKKGFVFMKEADRMEIIDAVKWVDYVVPWDDDSQFVSGAIKQLNPDIFAKGGDRDKPENVPEWTVCQKINCEVVFGVGGGKIRSSSELVKNSEAEKK